MQRLRNAARRAFQLLGTLVLFGLLLAAFTRDLAEFPRSATWHTAQGEITESRFSTDEGFTVDFEYTYTVNGTTYTGSRITFFQYAVFANRYQNEQFIRQHRAGTPVEVRYDPRNPSRSVLMRTIPLSQLWSPLLFAVCLVTILVSGVLGFLVRRLLRKARAHIDDYAGDF